jgi:DNA-binding transcriptional regulator YdaS (Cro superfamily)
MSSMVTKLGVAAAIGVVFSVAVYSLTGSKKSSSSSTKKKKKNSSKLDVTSSGACDLQKAIRIFASISQNVALIQQNLNAYEAQVRERAAGQVTEEELRDHINQTFVKELVKIEREVYKKFQVAESDVQAAVKVYGEDQQLKVILDQLKMLFTVVRKGMDGATKPSEMKLAKGLDRDKVLEIFKKVMDSIIVSIDEAAKQVQPDGGKLQNSQVREFNVKFQAATNAASQRISQEYKITQQVRFEQIVAFFLVWHALVCHASVSAAASLLLLHGTKSKRYFVHCIHV